MAVEIRPSDVPSQEPYFNILALSGGGYRGLFGARVLKHLEASSAKGKGLRDSFNLIVGTSVGGLLAAGVAFAVPAGRIEDAIRCHGPNIFDRRYRLGTWRVPLRKPRGITGRLFSAPYRQADIRIAVEQLLEKDADTSLAKSAHHLVLTAVDAYERQPVLLGSRLINMKRYGGVTVMDALLATTAAPTYFPPHPVDGTLLIDGGIVANAPDLVGIIEAMAAAGASWDRIRIVSIGTCAPSRATAPYDRAADGIIQSALARGLMLTTLEAQEGLTKVLARQLLGARWVEIDHTPAADQARALELDDASDAATTILLESADAAFANLGVAERSTLRLIIGQS